MAPFQFVRGRSGGDVNRILFRSEVFRSGFQVMQTTELMLLLDTRGGNVLR